MDEESMSFAAELESLENEVSSEEEYSMEGVKCKWANIMQVYAPLFFQEGKTLVGDQIILPPHLLDQFTKDRMEFPLFFLAKNLVTGTTISCRAYEFTAPPNIAIFSDHLMEELFIESGSHVQLSLCTIPKATFLGLRALDSDYLRWSNQKAVLETAIKQYGTVTLDSTIILHFGGSSHRFLIVGLEPEPHANLIDTDVTVALEDDVDAPLDFSVDQQVTEVKKEVEETQPAQSITKEPKEPTRRRRRRRGEPEPETIVKETKNEKFAGEGRRMGRVGSSAAPANNNLGNGGYSMNTPSNVSQIVTEQPPNTLLCKNCKKFVPDHSFDRHEAFCSRNNFCCPVCDQSMPISKQETHFEEVHKPVPCQDCQEDIEPSEMANHLENTCPKRMIRCEFCMLNFPSNEVFDHSMICGSRTEKCDLCNKYVRLREFSYHSESNCQGFPDEEPRSSSHDNYESNSYYRSFMMDEEVEESTSLETSYTSYTGSQGADDLTFCPYCLAPFMDYDALVEHMTSQNEILLNIMKFDCKEDLEPVTAHLGAITETEEVQELVNAALTTDTDYLSDLLAQNTLSYDVKLENGYSLLHIVVEKNKCKTLANLIQLEQMNVNVFDDDHNTPLHYASKLGRMRCLEVLLGCERIDHTLLNKVGHTAIHCCLNSSELTSDTKADILKLFLERKDMRDIALGKKYANNVKESVVQILRSAYNGSLDDESKTIQQLENFLRTRSLGDKKKMQRHLMRRIQHKNLDHVTGQVNDNCGLTLKGNNAYTLQLLNNGTLPFYAEVLFPTISGVTFTVLSEINKTLQQNEESEIVIQIDSTDIQLVEGCNIFIRCKSVDITKNINAYYCLVPLINAC